MPKTLPTNGEIAECFELFADLLDIEGGQSRHRVLAYRRGAARARATAESVAALAVAGRAIDLADIGQTLQDKIVELAETGAIGALTRLTERVPAGLATIARLRDIGPKRAKALWLHLDVTDVPGLTAALSAGRLEALEGFGPKTLASIADQLAAADGRRPAGVRHPIGAALPLAQRLVGDLQATPGVVAMTIAGGLRRGAETVHDIDIAVATTEPGTFAAAVADHPVVAAVVAGGERGMAADTHPGIRVEFRFCAPQQFGNLLQHLTGSRAHNIRLRELAVRQGLSVSEHGIADRDGAVHTAATEEGVYEQLGLPWIPPELREDSGEIAVAQAGLLPNLLGEEELRGDLHVHTDWSDGRDSLTDMVCAAADLGLQYLGISDHSKALAMARGLDAERVRRQWDEIDTINATRSDITVLKACEVDVLADGSLDHDDDLLAGFDWVTASLHSGFRQSSERLTARILAAIAHPLVNAIGHPTGRMFGRREGYAIDLERVIAAAAATGTALEINAQPRRLDLNADMARRALAGGVRLIIGTDAHSTGELAVRSFGVTTARRAGATAASIVNTRDVAGIRALRADRRAASGA